MIQARPAPSSMMAGRVWKGQTTLNDVTLSEDDSVCLTATRQYLAAPRTGVTPELTEACDRRRPPATVARDRQHVAMATAHRRRHCLSALPAPPLPLSAEPTRQPGYQQSSAGTQSPETPVFCEGFWQLGTAFVELCRSYKQHRCSTSARAVGTSNTTYVHVSGL